MCDRGELAALPGAQRQRHRDSDQHPCGEVEESVRERVGLQTGHGAARVLAGVGEHVMPLQDLVQDDPVDEPPEADADEERRAPSGSCECSTRPADSSRIRAQTPTRIASPCGGSTHSSRLPRPRVCLRGSRKSGRSLGGGGRARSTLRAPSGASVRDRPSLTSRSNLRSVSRCVALRSLHETSIIRVAAPPSMSIELRRFRR
jgi:hypothetical protein